MKEYLVYLVCNKKDIPVDSLALGECLGAFFDKEKALEFLYSCRYKAGFSDDDRAENYYIANIHVEES